MNKSTLPCLIISYKRFDGVVRLMNFLHEQGVTEIFLAIDGPKDDLDADIQLKMVSWAENFGKENNLAISIFHRSSNLGVALGVITALDWFFSINDFGVVLEDDLVVSSYFLDFVLHAKGELETDSNVWMISGDQFFEGDQIGDSSILINYPLVWGWASFASRWEVMKDSLLSKKVYSFRLLLSPIRAFWYAGSSRVLDGSVDTWDIPLAYEMRIRNRLTIIPPLNLIKNVGFDSSASHTDADTFPLNLPIDLKNLELSKIGVQRSADITKYWNSQLEKQVFLIRWYHIFSPLKYFLSRKRYSYSPLKERLSNLDLNR